MSGAIPPIPLYTFIALTVTTLPLTVNFLSFLVVLAASQFISSLFVLLISCLSHLFLHTNFMAYPYKIMDPRS
jgi:hypothetical protein